MEQKLCELTIEITQKCPNRCMFCSSYAHPNATVHISAPEIISVVSQAKQLGLKRVNISGGEPLCHEAIEDVLASIHSEELAVNIYTTGIRLSNDGMSFPFTEWGRLAQPDTSLIFNIQSTDDVIHDALIRRTGALHQTRQSILSALKSNVRVEVHVVPNKQNLFNLEKTVEDLASWGVKQVSFLRLVPQGYARSFSDKLLLSNEETEILKNTFFRISQKTYHGMTLRFGIPFSGLVCKAKTCTAGEKKLIVRYDGKVLPCEAFKDDCLGAYVLGDIRTDSLADILKKAASSNLLHKLKSQVGVETCPAQRLY